MRLPEPDPTYRLAAADRAKVRHQFDRDALERLLAAIEPEERENILKRFQAGTGYDNSHLTMLVDPVLHELLEDVYRPFWDALPDADLERIEKHPFPGLRRAKERRAAARLRNGGPPP